MIRSLFQVLRIQRNFLFTRDFGPLFSEKRRRNELFCSEMCRRAEAYTVYGRQVLGLG